MIHIKTNMGTISLVLDQENTPLTAANFLQYVESKFYEGTIFHRVIDGFMVQGGGLLGDMTVKPNEAPIANEARTGKQNKRGSVAMARTSDPDSATSQFFINVKDNDFLDFREETTQGYGYCVFAEVVEGMDVVDAIKAVKTGTRQGYQDVPVDPVTIEEVTVSED